VKYLRHFKVKKIGGSLFIPLTSAFREAGIREGNRVSVTVDDSNKIIIEMIG